jgi:Ca2+-binding RTX toxin-like protein
MARSKPLSGNRTLFDALAANAGQDVFRRLNPGNPNALAGTSGPDVLVGTSGPDALQGLGGNDILVGLAGTDQLEGGTGDDIFYIEDSTDTIVELTGEGFDSGYVYAAMTYVLAAGVSVEWLAAYRETDTLAINLTGNELVNYLVGNAGANTLNGGGGADFLIGNGGDDTYLVDVQGDYTREAASGGFDTIITSVSYKIHNGQEIERLETSNAAGTAGFNLQGNEFAQAIFGNAGSNSINGGGGADTMTGYAGDDRYFVDNTDDVVVEAAGEGYDVVFSGATWVLGAGVSIEVLSTARNSDTTAINLTGNEFGQTIFGNDGSNVIDGKGGSDFLLGLAGNDTFAFTTVLAPDNVDYINNFAAGADKIALDDAIFAGIGTPGAFNADAFRLGFDALDADDRIMYTSYGELFYDADGNGEGAAVLFALLGPSHPNLTVSDFVVI